MVADLYNAGTPIDSLTYLSASSLAAFWRMGDDSRDSVSDAIYDQTINEYNLSPNGFTKPHGIVNHGPEGLDAWYKLGAVNQWGTPGIRRRTTPSRTELAYTYNDALKEHSGLSGVTASYAKLQGFDNSPSTMFSLGVFVPSFSNY